MAVRSPDGDVRRKARVADRAEHRAKRRAGPYTLIVRGPDGRPRSERFTDAAAYRARLATLQFTDSSLSIDEVVGALDALAPRPA